MRGFLAIGVFIHHSSIWYQYLQSGSWGAPKSNLFNQFGQTSVALFFMITAFLFTTKLLNTYSNNKNIDWSDFFISRVFRLVPMYLVSIMSLVVIVLVISDWKLNVSVGAFLKEVFCWGIFTIRGAPDINGFVNTGIINAEVGWSLPYEWLFYFSLPMLSIFFSKNNVSKLFISISIVFILFYCKYNSVESYHLWSFFGGAISPFLIKYGADKMKYNSIFFSVVIILCLASILRFHSSNDFICKFLIIIVFNLIALGNTLFGILKISVLKFLGEISYSTYLTHGIIIFLVINFCIGFKEALELSPTKYCLIIFCITPIIVLSSFMTYLKIEKPFMNYSKRNKLRK